MNSVKNVEGEAIVNRNLKWRAQGDPGCCDVADLNAP